MDRYYAGVNKRKSGEDPTYKPAKHKNEHDEGAMTELLSSIYESTTTTTISAAQFGASFGVSLLLGILIAAAYMYNTRYTKSFVVTLAMLPAIICVIIAMVNGSIGAGIAVAGAFSLVRFRSVPGTAKEICAIFLAMATGLATGMGYLGLATAFTAVLALVILLSGKFDFGTKKNADRYKSFRIVIPEDLDYSGVFDDLFAEYTTSYELVNVRTTNMGSMFRLTYDVTLKDPDREKELIDKIRCRNGNLEINVSRQATAATEL